MIKKMGIVFVFAMITGMAFPCFAQIDITKMDKGNPDSLLGELLGEVEENADLKIRQVTDEAQTEAEAIDVNTKQAEERILNPWKDKLPFPLTLDKIRAFIIAGRAIEKSNRSWDTLIAGAPAQESAMGFYQQGLEDASRAIKEVPGITLEEYRILYNLSINDPDFSMLLQALRYHIYPDDAGVDARGIIE